MLVRMNVAAGFAAAFTAIVTTVLTRYAQTLQMPPFGFGLLAALPFLTALVQLPASYLVERFGHRKLAAIWPVLMHRALWIAIAAVPWALPHAWWWPGLLVLMTLSSTSANLGTPAITSWAADLVPSRLRGRYYALRGQFTRLINVPIALVLGWAMDRTSAQGTQALLLALSLMLGLGGALGMVDLLLCFALPDRWHRPRADGLRFREVLQQPLADRGFRYFLGYSAFITFATGYVGPFIWLYLVDIVKETNLEATAQTIVGTALVSLLGLRFWGEKVDRWGYRRTMLVAGLLIVNGATAWALVTPGAKWIGYLAVLVSSFAWPAMELASSNFLFTMSQSRQQDGPRLGSAYVALNSTVVAVAGTLSGLFAGWVAQALQGWHLILRGWPVTFHVVLFFISAVVRIAAILCVLGMRDDRHR